MILRQNITPWMAFFSLRQSILRKVWPRVAMMTAFAGGIAYLFQSGIWPFHLTTTPFSLIGVALGIFLGFRTNSSYDRFWEGRRLWGRMVNITRTYTRQLELYIRPAEAREEAAAWRRECVLRLIAYVHIFRDLLRRRPPESLAGRIPDGEAHAVAARRVPPNALIDDLTRRLGEAYDRGWIDKYHVPAVDASLREITDIQGGCERIRNTPVPFSYSLLIHRIANYYCLFLPVGIVETVGLATPVVTFLISYAFLGLDAVGDEVEDPFGLEPNDLPLDALSRGIEIDLLQILGETQTPPEVQPVDDVLL